MLYLAGLVLAASVLVAQEPAPDHHAKLDESLGWIIGQWEGEGEYEGATYRRRWTYEWAPSGHCILGATTVHNTDGEKLFTSHSMIYWDAAEGVAKAIFLSGVGGAHVHSTLISQQDEKLVWLRSGVSGAGERSAAHDVWMRGEGGTFITRRTFIGDEVVERPPMELRRVGATRQLGFLEPLVGQWKVVTREGDEVISEGEEKCDWILNKRFMRHSGWWYYEGKPVRYEIITGWDAHQNKIVTWGVGANESAYGFGRRVGSFDAETNTWTSREKGLISTGEATSQHVEVKLPKDGSITIDFTQRRHGDTQQPDAQDTFTRETVETRPGFNEEVGPGYEELKTIEWLVGDWNVSGKWEDGKPHVGEEQSEWIFNKNAIRGTGWFQDRDGVKIEYVYMIVWDPNLKQFVMPIFDSQGYVGTRLGTYEPDTKTLSSKQQGVFADGTLSSFDQDTTWVNDDRFDWVGTNFEEGADKLPKLTITFTRK